MRELIGGCFKNLDMCIDNRSAIKISRNPVHHGRMKHIEVCYHFIRNCVEEDKVKLKYVRTENQLPNLFTKPLGISNLFEF